VGPGSGSQGPEEVGVAEGGGLVQIWRTFEIVNSRTKAWARLIFAEADNSMVANDR